MQVAVSVLEGKQREESYGISTYTHYTTEPYFKLPETTLHMDGESLMFLVDSGATYSVIQDKHLKNPKMSARFIYSKSACGMVVREEFTMPVLCSNTIDGDTESVEHGFLLSPVCPVNLLGKDMMLQPRISLISTLDGLKVIRTPSSPTMVKCNTRLFMFISGKFRFHYHKT